MKKIKTMRISDVIRVMKAYKDIYGDMLVIHQGDPEGNYHGTLHPRSFAHCKTSIGNCLFICPFDEHIDDDLWKGVFEEQNNERR